MTRIYTPGPEADSIVERQLATGNFASADEVVRAGLQLLQEQAEMEALEALELDKLRRAIAEGDAAYARGEYTEYTSAEQFVADIKRLGGEPSPPRG
jgi:putative addiction module CopG family antidote